MFINSRIRLKLFVLLTVHILFYFSKNQGKKIFKYIVASISCKNNFIYSFPKVSIFITVFNKEKYIKKCIESIINQTLKELEIIFIIDSSTDESENIIKKYQNYYNNIKIINNDKNRGLLYSRAMGVLYSKGEYLMNIDADDYLLDKNSVELLYNEAKKDNVDIIKFSVLTEYWGFNDCRNFNKIYYQPDIYDESFYNGYIIDLHITDKFIKNDLFKKAFNNFGNEIYGRNWNKHEDNIWNLLVRKNAISMKCMKNKIFAYQKHENSSLSLSQDQISDSMYSLFLADKLNEIINDENNKNVIQIYTNITKVLSIKILNSNTELKQKLINLGEKLLTQKNINEITKKKIKEIINCVNS